MLFQREEIEDNYLYGPLMEHLNWLPHEMGEVRRTGGSPAEVEGVTFWAGDKIGENWHECEQSVLEWANDAMAQVLTGIRNAGFSPRFVEESVILLSKYNQDHVEKRLHALPVLPLVMQGCLGRPEVAYLGSHSGTVYRVGEAGR